MDLANPREAIFFFFVGNFLVGIFAMRVLPKMETARHSKSSKPAAHAESEREGEYSTLGIGCVS
jgi:hypothetical protein